MPCRTTLSHLARVISAFSEKLAVDTIQPATSSSVIKLLGSIIARTRPSRSVIREYPALVTFLIKRQVSHAANIYPDGLWERMTLYVQYRYALGIFEGLHNRLQVRVCTDHSRMKTTRLDSILPDVRRAYGPNRLTEGGLADFALSENPSTVHGVRVYGARVAPFSVS